MPGVEIRAEARPPGVRLRAIGDGERTRARRAGGRRHGGRGSGRRSGAAQAVSMLAACCSPSSTMAASRILYFWTLPLTVIGYSSTNL